MWEASHLSERLQALAAAIEKPFRRMRPPQIVALVFLALVLTGGCNFVSAGMLQNPRADELFNGAFYRDVGQPA